MSTKNCLIGTRRNILTGQLKIIDLCDYLILGIDTSKDEKMSTFQYALELYKNINIPVNVQETEYNMTLCKLDIIKAICGKYIKATDLDKKLKILMEDIPKILEFETIKNYWKGINTNRKLKSDKEGSEKIENIDGIEQMQQWDKNSLSYRPSTNCMPLSQDLATDITYKDCNTYPISDDEKKWLLEAMYTQCSESSSTAYRMKQCTFVIYNSLFNKSLVVIETRELIHTLCSDFTEFQIECEFDDIGIDQLVQCKIAFDNRYFDIFELRKKLLAFKNMCNFLSEEKQNHIDKDLENIKDIIDKSYDIVVDSNEKVYCEDLHNYLMNAMPCLENYPKCKFQHHLTKLGLVKKRIENGDTYYCGIRMKRKEDMNKILEDLINKRKSDDVNTN